MKKSFFFMLIFQILQSDAFVEKILRGNGTPPRRSLQLDPQDQKRLAEEHFKNQHQQQRVRST